MEWCCELSCGCVVTKPDDRSTIWTLVRIPEGWHRCKYGHFVGDKFDELGGPLNG